MIAYLWLTPAQTEEIGRHALMESPYEACGIIAGVDKQVKRIIPVPNVATDPNNHYELDQKILVKTMFELEAENLSLLGFYHSHPNGHPIPSPTDIKQATYPDAIYLIAGLAGNTPRLAAWQIRSREVNSVDLHISVQPPDNIIESTPLSRAQKVAIILSAVLALIFMLVLSLSLLPPAPILTPTP